MPNEVLSPAIQEAYASAPSELIIINTLELRHQNFDAPIRVTNDYHNLTATLEAGAEVNGGEEVEFISRGFEFTLPPVDSQSTPNISITIDNVDRFLTQQIEKVVESLQPIRLTYRPYLSNDTSQPQYNPPLNLVLTDIVATVFQISAKAYFHDFANRSFPSEQYTLTRFPRLIA